MVRFALGTALHRSWLTVPYQLICCALFVGSLQNLGLSQVPATSSGSQPEVSAMDLPVSSLAPVQDQSPENGEPSVTKIPETAFQPGRPDVPPTERTLRFRGIDLNQGPWFVSSSLGPTATPEQLAVDASPTSALVVLRAPRLFDKATLFTVLDLETVPDLPAMLTLGHVDGLDEAYINGRQIGRTDLGELGSAGLPRRYVIPEGFLKKGPNVLAISITGMNGRTTFGLAQPPLTFQFMPKGYGAARETLFGDPKYRLDRGLTTSDVQQLIAAGKLDAPPEKGILRRRPTGWGRFAASVQDGLPSVEYVSPIRLRHRTAPGLELVHDQMTSVTLSGDSQALNAFGKSFMLEALHGDQSWRAAVSWSVLYPGFRILGLGGSGLPIRFQFSGIPGEVAEIPLIGALSGFAADSDPLSLIMAYQPRSRTSPLVLLVNHGAVNLTRSGDTVDLAIKPTGEKPVTVHAFYPLGTGYVDMRAMRDRPSSEAMDVVAQAFRMTSHSLVRHWVRVGGFYPTAADEWYQVSGGAVRCHTVVRFAEITGKLGDSLAESPAIPRPPFVDALAGQGVPGYGSQGKPLGIGSWSGPLYEDPKSGAVRQGADQILAASTYDLPLVSLPSRLLPGGAETAGTFREWLRVMASDLGSSDSVNALSMLGDGFGNFQAVWPYLDSSDRRALGDKYDVLAALSLRDGPPWAQTTESLSGKAYTLSGRLAGSAEDPVLIDLGLSRFVGRLSLQVMSRPRSEAILQRFSKAWSVAGYLFASDDWEWMKSSSSLRGLGSGGNEHVAAQVAAMEGLGRMAQMQNRPEQVDQARYFQTRAMTALLARLSLTDWRGYSQGISSTTESLILGTVEGGPALSADPQFQALTALESSAGLYEWPMVFEALYLAYPEVVRNYQKRMARPWQRGVQVLTEGGELSPAALAGLVSQVGIRARLRLNSSTDLERVLRLLMSRTDLPERQSLAAGVSEVAQRDVPPIYLLGWDGLEVIDFRVDGPEGSRNRRTATIKVRPVGNGQNLSSRLILYVGIPTQSVSLNGGPIPLTDMEKEGNLYRIAIRRRGDTQLEVRY